MRQLKDLSAKDIIEAIKIAYENANAPYRSKGYLYYQGEKLSPKQIFDKILNIYEFYGSNYYNDINLNIYTKLLSILEYLNSENIYLKLPDGYKGKIPKIYEEQLKKIPNEKQKNNQNSNNEINIKKHPLNQILYGSPGTGKTFNTINIALEIIDGEVPRNREDAKERFKELRDSGQIEFITFHQSYGYEEFIEGIKAVTDEDKNIQYTLEDGFFKRLVQRASTTNMTDFNQRIEELKNKILNQGSFNISTITGKKFEIDYRKGSNSFLVKPKDGYYLIPIKNIDDFYHKRRQKKDFTHPSYVVGIANYLHDSSLPKYNKIEKNYVLIIDEINRGNISKIFGELITLIEPSKRLGADEELQLTLPNSKELFGVPLNLYIIGTMNTADRSIAQIDTALRRRFKFIEMMPKPELIVDKDNRPIIINGIKVQEVLKAINERIEYIYDREHTIGHSYFMPLIKEPMKDKLDEIFRFDIIPLLAEYFYSDWEDIKIILNDNKGYFIKKESPKYKIMDKSRINNQVYTVNSSFSKDGYINIYDGN